MDSPRQNASGTVSLVAKALKYSEFVHNFNISEVNVPDGGIRGLNVITQTIIVELGNCAVFSMKLRCSGKSSSDVDVRMQLNVSIFSPINFTRLDIRRRKTCLRNPALGKNTP